MKIYNRADAIEFYYSASRTISVKRGDISTIRKHYDYVKDKYRVVVHCSNGNKVMFDYDSVTTPVTLSVDDLITLLFAYNAPAGTMTKFVATAGQTVFTLTEPLKAETIAVIDGSVQSWGYTATEGEYQVTFTAAFVGGEEVIIISW